MAVDQRNTGSAGVGDGLRWHIYPARVILRQSVTFGAAILAQPFLIIKSQIEGRYGSSCCRVQSGADFGAGNQAGVPLWYVHRVCEWSGQQEVNTRLQSSLKHQAVNCAKILNQLSVIWMCEAVHKPTYMYGEGTFTSIRFNWSCNFFKSKIFLFYTYSPTFQILIYNTLHAIFRTRLPLFLCIRWHLHQVQTHNYYIYILQVKHDYSWTMHKMGPFSNPITQYTCTSILHIHT